MWHNITLGKFQQLTDIKEGQNFDHEIERTIKLLACLHELPEDYYERMPVHQLKEETERLQFLFADQLPVTDPPRFIEVNGRRYKPLYVFTDVVSGQFIDCMSTAKDRDQLVYNLHRLLASICVPCRRNWLGVWTVGEYGDISFDQVAEDMLQVPIITVNSIALFFWTAWINFLEATPGYSQKIMKIATMMQADLQSVGVGSPTPQQ